VLAGVTIEAVPDFKEDVGFLVAQHIKLKLELLMSMCKVRKMQ